MRGCGTVQRYSSHKPLQASQLVGWSHWGQWNSWRVAEPRPLVSCSAPRIACAACGEPSARSLDRACLIRGIAQIAGRRQRRQLLLRVGGDVQ